MIPSASFDREFAVSYSIDLGVDPDATTSLIKRRPLEFTPSTAFKLAYHPSSLLVYLNSKFSLATLAPKGNWI